MKAEVHRTFQAFNIGKFVLVHYIVIKLLLRISTIYNLQLQFYD
jgi:hypothetical protein